MCVCCTCLCIPDYSCLLSPTANFWSSNDSCYHLHMAPNEFSLTYNRCNLLFLWLPEVVDFEIFLCEWILLTLRLWRKTKNTWPILKGKQELLSLSWTKQATIFKSWTHCEHRWCAGWRWMTFKASKHESRGQTQDVLSRINSAFDLHPLYSYGLLLSDLVKKAAGSFSSSVIIKF